jgi:hypothetical protein
MGKGTRLLAALRVAAGLALLPGLAGCMTPEELRLQDEAACRSFGFQANTNDFAACLQRESLARRYGGNGNGYGTPVYPYYYW